MLSKYFPEFDTNEFDTFFFFFRKIHWTDIYILKAVQNKCIFHHKTVQIIGFLFGGTDGSVIGPLLQTIKERRLS